MQTSQLKWILIGGLSLLGLGHYYRQLTREQLEYRSKIEEFNEIYKKSKIEAEKTLGGIVGKLDPTQVSKVVCLENLRPVYNADTFKIYERQRSVFASSPKYEPQHILQHQMGGHFHAIRNNKQKIMCKLNDFHLEARLLQEKRQPVSLFKEINNLQPIVESVTSTLNPLLGVAIYGKLYYDNSKLSWAIEPFFLTGASRLPQAVQKFYDQKNHDNANIKMALFFGGLILGYFTIVSPLTRWFERRKLQRQQRPINYLNDFEYFRKKDQIIVKGESLLNCEDCKTKNVEIVYECGHLALCQNCHNKNESKKCPLCNQFSTRFMKIYMA